MKLQEWDTKMSSKCSWMEGLILMWQMRVETLHFIWPLLATTKTWHNCYLNRGQSLTRNIMSGNCWRPLELKEMSRRLKDSYLVGWMSTVVIQNH